MGDIDQTEELGARLAALDDGLAVAADMTAAFSAELSGFRQSMRHAGEDMAGLERSLSHGISRAMREVVVHGSSLSDALSKLAGSMLDAVFNAALKPVTSQVGGVLGQGLGELLQFAHGGSFAQGRVMPFATGGVVTGPVGFPMRGGMGLMGEAGPEAILPLARGADGKLGVRAGGGCGAVQVVMNISTPDAESFRRSHGQIATELGRLLGRGQRNR